MAIIDNTYFKGEIYIPHAKPNASDEVLGVAEEMLLFIDQYEREALLTCLGRELYYALEGVLDSAQTNGVKANTDQKWIDLLNGKDYTDPAGDTVKWRGIRFKSNSSLAKPNMSFIAYYVYFYYEKNDHITRSDVGHVQENAKNAWNVTPREKVVKAWNRYVDLVQGKEFKPSISINRGLVGIDYYDASKHEDVSLYKFIEDSNTLIPNTYSGFLPTPLKRINSFGL